MTTLRDEYGKYTKSSEARLCAMRDCLIAIGREAIPGDIVECGVWRGGNIIMARKLAPGRVCWLYDTFAGMTAPTAVDRKRKSGYSAIERYAMKTAGRPWAAVPVDEVRGYLDETATLDETRLRFVVGPVEQTLLDPTNLPERIALLRLDTDWHASTKIELEILWPRLVSRGFLIVDDFGHWEGARKAVEDYFGAVPPIRKWIDDTAILIRAP